jgi:protein-S-isoprenylcysteine O-methyltransferase Ste14
LLGAALFLGWAVRYALLVPSSFANGPGQGATAVLVCLRLLLVGVFLLLRERPRAEGSLLGTGVALTQTLVFPFLYSPSGSVLFRLEGFQLSLLGSVFLGNALALWGSLSLGRSFGVTPAVRKRVLTGAYRWLRHPIYVGYCVAEGAYVLQVPTPRNLGVFAASAAFFAIRARFENRLLGAGAVESEAVRRI